MSPLSPVTNNFYYRQTGSDEKLNLEPVSPCKENISESVPYKTPAFKPIENESPVIFDMDD